jgi:hypothetical protein
MPSKVLCHNNQRSARPVRCNLAGRILRSCLAINDSLAEKVDYICQNPVRAGLVKVEGEYRWLWRGAIPIL